MDRLIDRLRVVIIVIVPQMIVYDVYEDVVERGYRRSIQGLSTLVIIVTYLSSLA
jgi:Tfp pilus assembly protein PilE